MLTSGSIFATFFFGFIPVSPVVPRNGRRTCSGRNPASVGGRSTWSWTPGANESAQRFTAYTRTSWCWDVRFPFVRKHLPIVPQHFSVKHLYSKAFFLCTLSLGEGFKNCKNTWLRTSGLVLTISFFNWSVIFHSFSFCHCGRNNFLNSS